MLSTLLQLPGAPFASALPYSRPEARHERDGAQTGAGTYAVVKRVPEAANLRVVGTCSIGPGMSGWLSRVKPSQS